MEIKTPAYVLDIDSLRERVESIKALTDSVGVGLCYAIKANAFLTPYMLPYVEGLEVCSHGELLLCKKQGIPMDRIVMSGVNKEEAFVEDGILSGVGIITAESALHFEYICKYAALHKRRVEVILRLTSGAQFGMDMAVLRDIVEHRDKCEYVHIKGIHYFTGTQKHKSSKIIKELQKVYEVYETLKSDYGYEAELLEYGPGFGVSYFEGDDFEDSFSVCREVIDWISQNVPPAKLNFEMGRFFVAPCGFYHTRIADLKVNEDLNVCIIDGGKNHLSYYGQNMALKTPIIRKKPGDDGQKWTIFGSLCTFNDIVARDVELPDAAVGDELIFENAGAYSVTEGLYLFLSRDMPTIYAREKGELSVLREAAHTYVLNG